MDRCAISSGHLPHLAHPGASQSASPPPERDVPGRVDLGPVGRLLPWEDQVMQGIGVQDVGSCHPDTRACRWRPGRHEARQTCAVIRERKLPPLRNDLHDEMRAPVVWAPLERVRRGQQPAISAGQAQLDVNVSIGLAPQAIDNAGDRDAALLNVQSGGQVHASERRPRLALAGMEPMRPASCTGEQVHAAAERQSQHDGGQPWPSAANPVPLPERTHRIKVTRAEPLKREPPDRRDALGAMPAQRCYQARQAPTVIGPTTWFRSIGQPRPAKADIQARADRRPVSGGCGG